MFCQFCGKEVTNESSFCNYCGKPLFETELGQSVSEEVIGNNSGLKSGGKKSAKIVLALLVAGMVALIVAIILVVNRKGGGDSAGSSVANVNEKKQKDANYIITQIDGIDTSDFLAEARSVGVVRRKYEMLDNATKKLVTNYDKLLEAEEYLEDHPIYITADNYQDYFCVYYMCGTKQNYGTEPTTYLSGYMVEYDKDLFGDFYKTYTPMYSTSYNNDYATPVYIYVVPLYPEVCSTISFDINLHQRYRVKNFVDGSYGAPQEYKYQSGSISYDSTAANGIGEYLILVEDNKSDGGKYDDGDKNKKMDMFDKNKVVISSVSGRITVN